jgi:hypothetical protein
MYEDSHKKASAAAKPMADRQEQKFLRGHSVNDNAPYRLDFKQSRPFTPLRPVNLAAKSQFWDILGIKKSD